MAQAWMGRYEYEFCRGNSSLAAAGMLLRHTFHQMPVLVLHTTIAFFHFSILALLASD